MRRGSRRRFCCHEVHGSQEHEPPTHPRHAPAVMFRLFGIAVLVYTGFAVWRGEVFAKAGWRGRMISRIGSPQYFWTVIVLYAGLGIALLTVF
jgi:hypothetical protein